jgi:hypothetical protein
MNRTPPAEVRRALRKEVGFGCPVPGCRQALLTWHHFDPPWSVEQHHRPDGMIALCRPHHDAADHGTFSRDELRTFKRSTSVGLPAIAVAPWSKREFLVRLGGCYSGGQLVAVTLSGHRAIWFHRADDGLLLLSFQLQDSEGSLIAVMEDNMFEADSRRLFDLEVNTSATRLKFWLAQRKIGLDLSFKRVTMEQLSQVLQADHLRADAEGEARLPADVRSALQEMKSQGAPSWRNSPSFQEHPEHIREAQLSGDPTGTGVKRWVASHCLDDEGKVSLLDFEHLVLNGNGRRIVIHDGIATEGIAIRYSASFSNERGGFNF